MSRGFVLLLVTVLALPGAAGEIRHRFTFAGAGGVWLHPELGGHGIGIVAYDLDGLDRGGHLGVVLNTDTLRLHLDRFRFADGLVELGAFLGGEAGFAGLLPDYYREGKVDPERGFWASYLEAQAYLKLELFAHNYLSLNLGGRRWFFARADDTSPDLELPPRTWVLEPRLRYTLWWIDPDRSLWERHRLFPRVRGFALGFDVGADFRSEARPWGALDEEVFETTDPRNDPDGVAVGGSQWLMAGWQMHDRVRAQLRQAVIWGSGGDDLTRARVGGLNPYVVPVAGAPWASYLSEKVFALEWSWHFRLAKELEAGVLFDGVFLEDIHRVGDTRNWSAVSGLGVFLDWPIGAWQVDVRGGWAPPPDGSGSGQFAAFFSVGRSK